jgi:hypothetical protein
MAGRSVRDQQFTDAFNEALADYKADRLEECDSKLRTLIDDSALPRYHRMKSLVLLGLIVDDFHEANELYVAAEALWHIVRRWHPEGDPKVDSALKEIWESLEDLDESLREQNPDEYDRPVPVDKTVAEHDTDVEDARELLDDVDIEDN